MSTSERDPTPIGAWDDAHSLVSHLDAVAQDAGSAGIQPVARRDTPSADMTRRRAAPRELVLHVTNRIEGYGAAHRAVGSAKVASSSRSMVRLTTP